MEWEGEEKEVIHLVGRQEDKGVRSRLIEGGGPQDTE